MLVDWVVQENSATGLKMPTVPLAGLQCSPRVPDDLGFGDAMHARWSERSRDRRVDEEVKTVEAFKAFVIESSADGGVKSGIKTLSQAQLDPGEVTIRVKYSSINYKDALAATGAGKIIRRFPCVGGIDLCGEVIESTDPRFDRGDQVIATSFDIGVSHHGGYAEYARIPGNWVLPLPPGLTPFESMALGTAGFTAALAIERMEQNGLAPVNGPVVVTGATGGVGGLAIKMLSQLGYDVVAFTSKEYESDYLHGLGASRIQLSSGIDLQRIRPMEAGLWAGAVDNVGGAILHWVLATMKQAGTVASIGNAASHKLETTVFPFILRGVSLLGIDSGYMGFPTREQVWRRLAGDLKPRRLAEDTRTVELEELPTAFGDFLAGKVKGRTVVRIVPGAGVS
jgi:acrylyl-CoA reductase (NADPH)